MNAGKRRKTFLVAAFVSLSSLVSFNFLTNLTEGFIIALSIVVMEVFLYCFEDLTPMFVAGLSGILSPMFRFALAAAFSRNVPYAANRELPAFAYYFAFGIVFTLIYRLFFARTKNLKTFPAVIFFSDIAGNTAELLLRSVISARAFFDLSVFGDVVAIAFVRTFIVVAIIAAIENYLFIVLRKERDIEYQRLIEQATVIAEEVRLMDKNVAEIEDLMKKAYALYREMDEADYPDEVVQKVLDVAKNTHEVKGDYQDVIGVLKSLFDEDLETQRMRMSEVVRLVKANVLSKIRKRKLDIVIITRITADFILDQSFKMMSILRNLLTNAAEAIAEQEGGKGAITVLVRKAPDSPAAPEEADYEIIVHDDGPGIPEDELENIFLEGYSTKFNYITGYIQRGLGLSVVRDYIEQTFHGTIQVDSTVGKGTTFTITIPGRYIVARDEVKDNQSDPTAQHVKENTV